MGSAHRESTEQELVIDNVFSSIRSLDKCTWHSAENLTPWKTDLIDDAKQIQKLLDGYIKIIEDANI